VSTTVLLPSSPLRDFVCLLKHGFFRQGLAGLRVKCGPAARITLLNEPSEVRGGGIDSDPLRDRRWRVIHEGMLIGPFPFPLAGLDSVSPQGSGGVPQRPEAVGQRGACRAAPAWTLPRKLGWNETRTPIHATRGLATENRPVARENTRPFSTFLWPASTFPPASNP
jgi:hypothetical protein